MEARFKCAAYAVPPETHKISGGVLPLDEPAEAGVGFEPTFPPILVVLIGFEPISCANLARPGYKAGALPLSYRTKLIGKVLMTIFIRVIANWVPTARSPPAL